MLVASKVVEDDVRNSNQLLEHLPTQGVAEIECDTFLVTIEGLVEKAVILLGIRNDIASRISVSGWVLNLDDFRAQVCQVHRREWARTVLGDSENPNTLEGESHITLNIGFCQ